MAESWGALQGWGFHWLSVLETEESFLEVKVLELCLSKQRNFSNLDLGCREPAPESLMSSSVSWLPSVYFVLWVRSGVFAFWVIALWKCLKVLPFQLATRLNKACLPHSPRPVYAGNWWFSKQSDTMRSGCWKKFQGRQGTQWATPHLHYNRRYWRTCTSNAT